MGNQMLRGKGKDAGGASRNRTDVHGFAIRCITTLPLRQHLQEKRKRGMAVASFLYLERETRQALGR